MADATTGELVRGLYAYADDIETRLEQLPLDGPEDYRRAVFHAGTHLLNALDALNAAIARGRTDA